MKVNHQRRFDPNALAARDVLSIVPVIIGLLILFIVFAFSVSDEVYIKWGGLALNSAVLFGFFISQSRGLLREWRFCLETCVVLDNGPRVSMSSLLPRAD